MNILFVSKNGSSLGLAERVKKEGHNSYFYLLERRARRTGDGVVDKPKFDGQVMKESGQAIAKNVDALLKECDPDLVVFDMVHLGKVADYIRERGVAVFGGCRWADHAELDRSYGYKLMKRVGIDVPPTTTYKSGEYGKAISYVKQTKSRYVYKPSGNIDAAHTYVSEGWEDMVEMLELWRTDKCDFELQEWVDGVEVSCEMWWNGLSADIHNVTFEEKKFMTGGVGPTCGCAGNVVRMISPKSRIVREGVGRMERLLKKTNYRGPIDLNSIATPSKLYGLEFTVRLGYDAIQSLLELYKGSITRLLYGIARGGDGFGKFTSDYSISIRVSIPPYPHTEHPDVVQPNIPVLGVNNKNEKHIWWGDVYRNGKGKWKSAGVAGDLLCVVARGRDVMECKKRAYRTVDNLVIPQKQYRLDIGERVGGDEKKLKGWGYL